VLSIVGSEGIDFWEPNPNFDGGGIVLKLLVCMAVAMLLTSTIACGDDDGSSATPLAISDRLLIASDVPGYSVIDDFTWDDAEGVRDEGLGTSTFEASPEDAYRAVQDAGLRAGAGRIFERNDSSAPPDFVFVQVLELESEEGAREILGFSADDGEKPCPDTCAFAVTRTDVEGIPGARGVTRLATAESIAETGPDGFEPGELHRIAFTDGVFFYLIGTAHTPPSADAAEMAQELARALYARVKGAPAVDE
jgi:hypothetical protein